MDKSKIFIINTKGEIRYEAKDGEHCTDFIHLEEMCNQFFPNLFSLQRQDAVEDESKDAISCVCYKQDNALSSARSQDLHLHISHARSFVTINEQLTTLFEPLGEIKQSTIGDV